MVMKNTLWTIVSGLQKLLIHRRLSFPGGCFTSFITYKCFNSRNLRQLWKWFSWCAKPNNANPFPFFFPPIMSCIMLGSVWGYQPTWGFFLSGRLIYIFLDVEKAVQSLCRPLLTLSSSGNRWGSRWRKWRKFHHKFTKESSVKMLQHFIMCSILWVFPHGNF